MCSLPQVVYQIQFRERFPIRVRVRSAIRGYVDGCGLNANQSDRIGRLNALPWLPATHSEIDSKELQRGIARRPHKNEAAVGAPLNQVVARQGPANRPRLAAIDGTKHIAFRGIDAGQPLFIRRYQNGLHRAVTDRAGATAINVLNVRMRLCIGTGGDKKDSFSTSEPGCRVVLLETGCSQALLLAGSRR